MKDYSEINELQLDALKEISNIGAGNAATSLSQMLGRTINMSVPRASIAPFSEIGDYVGGADKVTAGGYLRVDGDMPMGMLFMIETEQAFYLLDILFGNVPGTSNDWTEMHCSAFKEIVNILSGSYLNALAVFTNNVYSPSVPAMAVDMTGAILGEVLQTVGEISDYALVLENVFIEKEKEITGQLFLLPEPKTLESLLKALGVL